MWNLLGDDTFAPEVLGTFVDLVDFWHLIEKLAPAAKVLHGEGPHRTTLRRWRIALRRRSGGGPRDATSTIIFHAVRVGFREQDIAYGSAMTLFFFLFVLLLSLGQKKIMERLGS